jgi:formate dehydrogenase subunit gamma
MVQVLLASTTDIEARTRDIIAVYLDREGPALPMLHAIQAAFGFVPAESVPVIALALNQSRAEIHGLVSFYHDFRHEPAGRHVLRLCRAEACQSRGADALAAHASETLGIGWHETTPDGAVTLEPIFCLGLCAAAPCGMIDGQTVARLDEARLDALLETIR